MIRTKTTVVVGAGAAVELEFPDARDILHKIGQSFDFQRLGTGLQTDDMQAFDALFKKVKGKDAALREAAVRLRAGSRLSSSLHALLQQLGDDQHVQAVGKLALAFFALQAEATSPMEEEPRDPGDLPLRGSENWLFQLASLVVDGVPRAKAESCLDNLHIVNFNCDRAVQHYMPWALRNAFGMDLTEAQSIVTEKLRIVQPYGKAGRLDWQAGDEPAASWGDDDAKALFGVAEAIRTAGEFSESRAARAALNGGLAQARRLLFLGFDFNPMDVALLFDERLAQAPETLVALRQGEGPGPEAVTQLLARNAGIGADQIVTRERTPCWTMLRDNMPLLGT